MARASLRHIFVVLRHGDRAPAFNPAEGSPSAGAEAAAWHHRLARSDAELDGRFPIVGAEHRLDSGASPWGRLTTFGAAQARARGAQLRERYGDFFVRAAAAGAVVARASAYERTQRCAQECLSALLPLGVSPLSIAVRDAASCNVAVFDANNGLLGLQQAVFAGADYAEREAAMLGTALRVSAGVPYFAPAGGDLSPRFQWIRAADVYASRRNHGPPLPADLASLETRVMEHLSWRFATLFSRPRALRLGAGGLLADVARAAVDAVVRPRGDAGSATVVCGHDVTLLPLVAALAAGSRGVRRVAVDGDAARPSRAARWPTFAAMLVIEVHGCAKGGGAPQACVAPVVTTVGDSRVVWRYHSGDVPRLGPGDGAEAAAANATSERLEGVLSVDALVALSREVTNERVLIH